MPEKLAQLLKLAAKHLNNGAPMQSSALLAYGDALDLLIQDRMQGRSVIRSAERALDSLKYSVGILHDDYCEAGDCVWALSK
jgi:hypothetical protein